MRIVTFLMAVLIFSGCAKDRPAQERGTLLFAMRLTQGAFTGVSKADTGFFFYVPKYGGITGYELKDGKVVSVLGGGSLGSNELRTQLEQLAFEPFDFEAEMHRVDEMLAAQARRGDRPPARPMTLDGAEYEIRFVFGAVNFALKRWNPGPEIDYYAAYSPKIAKLKKLIDLFALHYGRTKFQL